ncbi:MAG: NAD(P) transhydrogenase subunit alpha [Limosilactobacillus oris]|jgi:NAD(P) transhydrogenase subunit alpha|uniref:NAD(P) transhydrogenase subunit alpha n=1 Tax=Limosilactobacillus oris TaxID=1632 RepID=UPI0021B1C439|nr:NAD(P) transhydrogenase subunit alpha [Limosilactobacillus oris]MCH3911380.1 NAD(P) transhydrogenase subunit alpha [Limosilactobacillus oris]MCH3938630.1 NAD(P) transhydrogenase subunit alpha [Limosilactobacillus oris]MCI1980377.1 NAD(P) transhydrogenase subunit alpha [Limosilactobacillus oris]MCI2042734.1 NAD(P) transhydrogenase subunit alpha [Limosilactobacillus oris]UXC67963.1 NAD(P) transhydrogenase subunit alpha [Limosilactobacillus oris]
MAITIAALKEAPAEHRVSLVPSVVKRLVKQGCQVLIEKGAGAAANFADQQYEEAGAKVVDRDAALTQANLVTVVNRPDDGTLDQLKAGQAILGLLSLAVDHDVAKQLAEKQVTALSFELLPRTVSRAQSMDALSSQSSVAGYKAALVAADHFMRYFPMMITAAGTAKPAKVLVLGTGVAGLQAIGTAKRLGAIVSGYDVRPASRGEVESLGAKFLTSSVSAAGKGGYARQLTKEEQQQQQDELAGFIADSDIVITTARVPGKKPPMLVTAKSVEEAKPGSIFIDIAASDLGGNVAGSKPGEVVETANGAKIVGADNLPSDLATSSSEMYSKNVQAVIKALLNKEGNIEIDTTDDVMSELVATYQGEVISGRLRSQMGLPEIKQEEQEPADDEQQAQK